MTEEIYPYYYKQDKHDPDKYELFMKYNDLEVLQGSALSKIQAATFRDLMNIAYHYGYQQAKRDSGNS